ncbi:hypothetical protein XBO1_2550009 [Xenorhabdus bovienii str. oregonense]|uniref:Uncharacterized protein n=1 Tax=Xenorhabdus bovienii str. oregonense TaxID=1398202 RepID=A0A077P8K8_XENBV|nr:hypothetical protein XBO1_2550009 [Xenorhabdus bovienii str. oregonense]
MALQLSFFVAVKLLTHLRMGPFPAHLRRQMTLDEQITD